MYRANQHQMSLYDYLPPYHGELVEQNRWVRLAQAIDWDAFEQEYSAHFSAGGKIAIPARMAYGSLIIRAAYKTTDRGTIALIRESPYLQYFLGFETFTDEALLGQQHGALPHPHPPGKGAGGPAPAQDF